ncbi:ribonucleotide-diphosphate reductase subunit beta, partial [Brevundimonas vesicularis]
MNAITPIILPERAGLLTPSAAYKPFRYPWAFDMWKKQQQVHWMPEEVPLGEDIKDWASTLNDGERNLLTQIFRFFTQADIEVQDNYMERYGRVFKPTEVKMMLAAFGNMETIHIAAYALLLETIGMPESEFGSFMEYEAMRDKHDYMGKFGVDSDADICRTLAMFGGFSEGVQLFASFAMLMNFPRQNKMKGMGQIVSWSVRDESLHCEGIIKLYHAFNKETGA